MGDIESEQFQNYFEVEISDLDELESPVNSAQKSPLFSKPRVSLRWRRVYLLLLNGLLILAVVFSLATMASVRKLVGSVFVHPSPALTATLVPGVDLFYVRASPPWGRLHIDGHFTALPVNRANPPLRLARGQHQLIWQAYPFLDQRCTVSVPPNVEDTCRDHDTAQTNFGLTAWVITFSESLATLAGTPRAALLQTVKSALDARQSTDTVWPGERYVLALGSPACSRKGVHGNQCFATSNQPLRATLSFQLDTNQASKETCVDFQPGNCTLNYQDCRLFCENTFSASSSTREWDVYVPVLSLWTFVTMDGRVLARNVPDDSAWDFATGQILDESLVQLHITLDSSGLQFAVSVDMNDQGSGYFDPACAAMAQQVGSLNPPADANGVPLYLQWRFASGTLPAAGCLAVGTAHPEDGLTAPTPQQATQPIFYYLHRFGVLLAVNAKAQSSGLLLPLADAHEQLLARMLNERSTTQQASSISKKSSFSVSHGAVRM